jgi:hypothetical protein
MIYYDLYVQFVVKLKRSSKGNWLGTCPFNTHEDNKPSFSFSEINGLFNCFGCGEKGNAYQFAERMGMNPAPYMNTDYKSKSIEDSEFKASITSEVKIDFKALANEAISYN